MDITPESGEADVNQPDQEVQEARDRRWEERIAAAQRAYAEARFQDAERECRAALEEAQAEDPAQPRVAAALNELGEIYRAQGRDKEAEPLLQQSLDLSEQTLGPWHLQVAHALHNLAALCAGQERTQEAETRYQRAIAIEERMLGPEDSSLAASLNNLALIYKARGDFSRAIPLFQRALRLWLKAKTPEISLAATAMNNLGAVCYAQGKQAEAEALFREALQIKEASIGGRHPEVATILNNLAEVYDAQGRFAEAAPLLDRLVEIDIALLGPGHPDVARELTWLGRIAQAQTDYARAETLCRRSLAIREDYFGPESAQAAGNLIQLAEICELQGRHGEASSLSRRASRITDRRGALETTVTAEPKPAEEQALPDVAPEPDKKARPEASAPASAPHATMPSVHSPTEEVRPLDGTVISEPPQELAEVPAAQSLYGMAVRYAHEGKLAEAEKLYEGVLAIEEALPEKQGAALSATLNNLGNIQRALGRPSEAAWALQKSLAVGLRSLGPDHPYVAAALNNLAAVCADRRKLPEAERLCEESLRIEAKTPERAELATVQSNLAQIREAAGLGRVDASRNPP